MDLTGYYYILVDGIPEPVNDMLEWAQWFESADRIIAQIEIGEIMISTAFLGLDHNFGSSGPPILFETMVFGGPLDGETERYATLDDARMGHYRMVERVRESPCG